MIASDSPRERVLVKLRASIVSGRYRPGERLPTRAELERLHQTTPVTVQRAFDQLALEGFVVARGRQGTFVAERPPHLCRYALVFPYRDRPERPWPQFWRALAAEAQVLTQSNGHALAFSYGNETQKDREAYESLEADVLAHRLAGLIFASRPFYLRGSPVLEAPGIPRVAVMSAPEPPNVRAIDLGGDFLASSLRHLLGLGRRRIAVVTVPQLLARTTTALSEAGLDAPSYWVQTASPEAPETARGAVHLLMASNPGRRPDGLVIMDDNLVPHATAGLADAGLRAPGDVVVVGHANFPHVTPSAVPITRLGYDTRELLKTAERILDAERRGEPVAPLTTMPLVGSDAGVAADGTAARAGEGAR
jgi:DNA-binding LacI/PurR family transcriptional regulator